MSAEPARIAPGLPLRVGEPEGSETVPRAARLNAPRRADHSWRYATASDLEAISYTITLGRWSRPHELSKRANRVLRFFAALHRTGTAGYRGTRCSQGALASSVARATDEAASKRTVQRALTELVEGGYLEQSQSWGRRRQIGPDTWTREQICVYTLTEKATNIWSETYTSPPTTKSRTDDLMKPEFITQSSARDKKRAENEKKTKESVDASTDASTAPLARNEGENMPKPKRRTLPPGQADPRKPYTRKTAKDAILDLIVLLTREKGRQGKIAAARAAFELSGGLRPCEETTGIDWKYWIARWGSMSRTERLNAAKNEILPPILNQPEPPQHVPDKQATPCETYPLPSVNEPPVPSDEEAILILRNHERNGLPKELLARLSKKMGIERW